jgi:hypothetical protein
VPTIVVIDHAFSFPLRYFETHGPLPVRPQFLEDFSGNGRPTTTTFMSISSGKAYMAMALRGVQILGGDD